MAEQERNGGSAAVATADRTPSEVRTGAGGPPLIEIKGLCKSYPTFQLQDVDLTVAQGSVVGFVGANGAGKTTTIRCLLGLGQPDSGSIKVFGKDFGMGAGSKLTHEVRGQL